MGIKFTHTNPRGLTIISFSGYRNDYYFRKDKIYKYPLDTSNSKQIITYIKR